VLLLLLLLATGRKQSQNFIVDRRGRSCDGL
jgi:hypothetical protein